MRISPQEIFSYPRLKITDVDDVEKENLMTLLGLELGTFGRPSHSQSQQAALSQRAVYGYTCFIQITRPVI
jgi:hypothetical protein